MHNQIAFIGSSVVDVIVKLPALPSTSQDVNITSQQLSMGGCAFNASHIAHLLHIPYLLFSPIGTGIYGNYVRKVFHEQQIDILLETSEENGCCYCLVEPDGERTFLSYHGAEYTFKEEWFSLLDQYPLEHVYVCGLEIEEESGTYILNYMEQHPHIQYYFAPGPRFHHITQEKIDRLFLMHPILHLNKEEALHYSKQTTVEQAAKALFKLTQNTVIVTLGKEGTYLYENEVGTLIPTTPVSQVDTIGAGDAHIGAILAYRQLGYSFEKAVHYANIISGCVVSKAGALLSEEEFSMLPIER